MKDTAGVTSPIRCEECPLGHIYAHGRGGFCPRLSKTLLPSQVLLSAADADERLWFIKAGVFAVEIEDHIRLILPGSMMSVADLRDYGATAVLRSLTHSTVCWAPAWFHHTLSASDSMCCASTFPSLPPSSRAG
jgi:hypothetical protein